MGQIAHLDQDPSNDAEDNLAFLCFEHHSLYDSTTRQHKNYTLAEVKHMRNSLYEAIRNKEHAMASLPAGPPAAAEDPRYFNERRSLPDTDLIKSIWDRPHWRILIQPVEYLPGQFSDLRECEAFVKREAVIALGSESLPIIVQGTTFSTNSVPPYLRAETDYANLPALCESWALFQSGQFVLSRPLPGNRPAPKAMHYLEVLRVVTQSFEFNRRLSIECDFRGPVKHSVSLKKVLGHEIVVPNRLPSTRCKAEDIVEAEVCDPTEGKDAAFERARATALRIYPQFGWHDASESDLRRAQRVFGI
jgi:hypothetical protein